MFKIECLTKNWDKNALTAMCHPDYGLDCSPEGECPPEDGSDDCDPYYTDN